MPSNKTRARDVAQAAYPDLPSTEHPYSIDKRKQDQDSLYELILTALGVSNAERDARVRLLEDWIVENRTHYDGTDDTTNCTCGWEFDPRSNRDYKDSVCREPHCEVAAIQRARAKE